MQLYGAIQKLILAFLGAPDMAQKHDTVFEL